MDPWDKRVKTFFHRIREIMQKSIELSERDIERIMRVAMPKGLGFAPCVRMLLLEKLDEIENENEKALAPSASQ